MWSKVQPISKVNTSLSSSSAYWRISINVWETEYHEIIQTLNMYGLTFVRLDIITEAGSRCSFLGYQINNINTKALHTLLALSVLCMKRLIQTAQSYISTLCIEIHALVVPVQTIQCIRRLLGRPSLVQRERKSYWSRFCSLLLSPFLKIVFALLLHSYFLVCCLKMWSQYVGQMMTNSTGYKKMYSFIQLVSVLDLLHGFKSGGLFKDLWLSFAYLSILL